MKIVKAHVSCQLFHDIIFFIKTPTLHPISVKKLLTHGTLIANPQKLPQTKCMIHVFARSHDNVITMESLQTKPITLDNQKVGLSKLTWALRWIMGFGQKEFPFIFFMLSNCLWITFSSSSNTKIFYFTLAMASFSLKESSSVSTNKASPSIACSIFFSSMFLLISSCLCKAFCSIRKDPNSLKVLLTRPSASSLHSIIVANVAFAFNISTYKINVNGKFQMRKFKTPTCSYGIKAKKTKSKQIKLKHLHTFCSSTWISRINLFLLRFTLGNGILHI